MLITTAKVTKRRPGPKASARARKAFEAERRKNREFPQITGAHIKEWRKACGYTQVEAADALGVARRTFTRYERNEGLMPMVVWRCCRLMWLATDTGQDWLLKNFLRTPKIAPFLKKYAEDII